MDKWLNIKFESMNNGTVKHVGIYEDIHLFANHFLFLS